MFSLIEPSCEGKSIWAGRIAELLFFACVTAQDPCKQDNGGCQHICYRTPAGAVCDCHMGFELANNSKTECVDVDECAVPGACSQLCENTKGSYKCACMPGYRLERQHLCKATGQSRMILVH